MTPFYKELKNFKIIKLTHILFTEQEGEQGYQAHFLYTMKMNKANKTPKIKTRIKHVFSFPKSNGLEL